MGCSPSRKQVTDRSVKTEPVLETQLIKKPSKLTRMVKMFNWKSNLRSIPEANSFMEFSSSTDLVK